MSFNEWLDSLKESDKSFCCELCDQDIPPVSLLVPPVCNPVRDLQAHVEVTHKIPMEKYFNKWVKRGLDERTDSMGIKEKSAVEGQQVSEDFFEEADEGSADDGSDDEARSSLDQDEASEIKPEQYMKRSSNGSLIMQIRDWADQQSENNYYCKICLSEISWTRDSMREHFKALHQLTVEQYYLKFVLNDEQSQESHIVTETSSNDKPFNETQTNVTTSDYQDTSSFETVADLRSEDLGEKNLSVKQDNVLFNSDESGKENLEDILENMYEWALEIAQNDETSSSLNEDSASASSSAEAVQENPTPPDTVRTCVSADANESIQAEVKCEPDSNPGFYEPTIGRPESENDDPLTIPFSNEIQVPRNVSTKDHEESLCLQEKGNLTKLEFTSLEKSDSLSEETEEVSNPAIVTELSEEQCDLHSTDAVNSNQIGTDLIWRPETPPHQDDLRPSSPETTNMSHENGKGKCLSENANAQIRINDKKLLDLFMVKTETLDSEVKSVPTTNCDSDKPDLSQGNQNSKESNNNEKSSQRLDNILPVEPLVHSSHANIKNISRPESIEVTGYKSDINDSSEGMETEEAAKKPENQDNPSKETGQADVQSLPSVLTTPRNPFDKSDDFPASSDSSDPGENMETDIDEAPNQSQSQDTKSGQKDSTQVQENKIQPNLPENPSPSLSPKQSSNILNAKKDSESSQEKKNVQHENITTDADDRNPPTKSQNCPIAYVPEASQVSSNGDTSVKSNSKAGQVKAVYSEWIDQCVYDCQWDNFTTNQMEKFKNHLNQQHRLTIGQYAQTGQKVMSHKMTHQCELCSIEITHNSHSIGQHVLNKHKLKPDVYHKSFIINSDPHLDVFKRESGQLICPFCSDFKDESMTNLEVHLEVYHGIEPKKYKFIVKPEIIVKPQENTKPKVLNVEELEAKAKQDLEADKKAILAWVNLCTYLCRICDDFSSNKLESFTHHLMSRHKGTSMALYKVKHGPVPEKVIGHECFECGEAMDHDRAAIVKHLNKSHPSLNLMEYYRKHVKKQGQEGAENAPNDDHKIEKPASDVQSMTNDTKPGITPQTSTQTFRPKVHELKSRMDAWLKNENHIEDSKDHQCVKCKKTVKHSREAISDHLLAEHNMGLPKYFLKHIYEDLKKNKGQIRQKLVKPKVEKLPSEKSNRQVGGTDSPFKTALSNTTNSANQLATESTLEESDPLATTAIDSETSDPLENTQDSNNSNAKVSEKRATDTENQQHPSYNWACIKKFRKKHCPLSKKTFHKCHVCNKTLTHRRNVLKEHFMSHDLSIERYYDLHIAQGNDSTTTTNDTIKTDVNEKDDKINLYKECRVNLEKENLKSWSNLCEYSCMVEKCQFRTKDCRHLYSHKNECHPNITDAVYFNSKPDEKKTKMTIIVHHKCLVEGCQSEVLQTRRTLTKHVQKSHDMSLSKYYDSYVKKNRVQELSRKFVNPFFKMNVLDPRDINSKEQETTPAEPISIDGQTDNHGSKVSENSVGDTSDGLSSWANACEYSCLETGCSNISKSNANMYKHLLKHHKLSIAGYTQKHMTETIMTKRVLHKCCFEGCGLEILHQRKNIGRHVQTHKITLEEYYNGYIIKSPSPKPNPKTEESGQDISDGYSAWANACEYSCLETGCNYLSRHSSDFYKHLKKKHQKTTNAYLRNNKTIMTKRVLHKCHFDGCRVEVVQQKNNIAQHLRVHKITVEDYYNRYIINSTLAIKKDKSLSEKSSVDTIKKENVSPEKNCDQQKSAAKKLPTKRLRDDSTISGHLAKKQRVLLDSTSNQQPEYIIPDQTQSSSVVVKQEFAEEDVQMQTDMSTDSTVYEAPVEELVCTPKIESTGSIATTSETSAEDSNWMDGCTYSCKLCSPSPTFYKDSESFKNHVGSVHSMDPDKYPKIIGDPVVERTYFICRLCEEVMVKDKKEISEHLQLKHKTSPKIYRAIELGSQS